MRSHHMSDSKIESNRRFLLKNRSKSIVHLKARIVTALPSSMHSPYAKATCAGLLNRRRHVQIDTLADAYVNGIRISEY